jgi:chromosome segregation ATPase
MISSTSVRGGNTVGERDIIAAMEHIYRKYGDNLAQFQIDYWRQVQHAGGSLDLELRDGTDLVRQLSQEIAELKKYARTLKDVADSNARDCVEAEAQLAALAQAIERIGSEPTESHR